jgi:hypothetical protein
MRHSRALFLITIVFLSLPILAQQVQRSTTTLPPAIRDAKAIDIVNQVLSAAGGSNAVSAIHDFSATGEMTLHAEQDVNASVTITGSGPNRLRLDLTLPNGIRSSSINQGKWVAKKEDGTISVVGAQPPMNAASLVLPYLHLQRSLNNPLISFFYKGTLEIDGRSLHDIRIQLAFANSSDSSRNDSSVSEFLIDPATYQVVQTQDFFARHTVHILRYSDYKPQNGVLVPLSITEEIAGQQAWSMVLSQLTPNTGVPESAFEIK